MGLSFSEETGDGVTGSFIFAFTGPDKGYIRTSDIHVYIDDVETFSFTLTGTNQVTITPAPADQSEVLIRRIMPTDAPYTDYTRGNNFGQRNINNAFLQQLYLLHEWLDGFIPDGYQYKGQFDNGGNKLINVVEGTDPTDAVAYSQLITYEDRMTAIENNWTGYVAQADALLVQAVAARDAAIAAQLAAALSELNAANSANAAAASEAAAALIVANIPNDILVDGDIGVTVQAYDADTAKTDAAQDWTKPQRGSSTVANTGAFDQSIAQNFDCTPAGSVTLVFTNLAANQSGRVWFSNPSAYLIGLSASIVISSANLSKLSTAGTYLIGYETNSAGTLVGVTVSEAITAGGV